ncbi:hypothetical protein LIER_20911 [Lithospermum erythrorhizon]|uniref:Uncharacterized protein n=1 Tax=Lithospermum erythrorhizon TaxID=34254 RepID=A0AAV3QSB5_LITER
MGLRRGGKAYPGPSLKNKTKCTNVRTNHVVNYAPLLTLPPLTNDTSIDDLLRECHDANAEVFVDNLYANDEDVMTPFLVPDGSSHHGAFASETSSSEDDEQATAPSVISASTSNGNHVSRGHARPHILAPYLNELVGDEISGWFLPEIRFEWQTCWPKWKNVNEDEEKIGVLPSPFEILLAQNRKKNKLTRVDEGIHNASFNRAWEKSLMLFKISNDTTTLDLATQVVLPKEREERKVEREALESKIVALKKAQVDSTNELREMVANLRNELTQSRLRGSNSAT